MAITIDKAITRAYLISQLEAFEKHTLWVEEDRKVVDVPAHYEKSPTGLVVVADGTLTDPATEIEESLVSPILAGEIINIGDTVIWLETTYTTEKINVRRYGKLANFEKTKKYFIGDCCIYDDCIYQAIADVDGTDTEFPEDKFQMIGAASIVKIVVDLLPNPADVKEDSIFWLKSDEVDAETEEVIHKAGVYLFDKASGTYELYREYEEKDVEITSFFEEVLPEDLGYQGDEKLAVNSKYLHTQMKNLTAVIQEEINDIVDAVDNVKYIIIDDRAALDAIDLETLEDNSMNVFLVKKDDTVSKYEEIDAPGTFITVEEYEELSDEDKEKYQPVYAHMIDGTDPLEFESTLYGCVAFDKDQYPKKERVLEYIGKLANGVSALDTAIMELINKALYITIKAGDTYYIKDDGTNPDAKKVVEDSKQVLEVDEIKISDVIMEKGEGVTVGNFVVEEIAAEDILAETTVYVRRRDINVPVVAQIDEVVTKYEDSEGGEYDVYVTRLSYQGQELMLNEFENVPIDFNSDEYQDIEPGTPVTP